MEQSVMVNKLTLILLLIVSGCGKDVSISTRELETKSSLSDGNATVTDQEGILKRGTPDFVIVSGVASKVSIYSSYASLEFIAVRPLNSQTPIKFRGKVKKNEMVLEYVEAK
jgi:hypothetical protein